MLDYAPVRPRPDVRPRAITRKASLTAGLPISMIQQIDDLAEEANLNRSRLVEAALVAGLPLVATQIKADKAAAAAIQQPTVKE